jgi:AraC family transcriptional regulator, regulatory protein of adaptative response / methylated-DNA-[protein]-cysteine methyltransferase
VAPARLAPATTHANVAVDILSHAIGECALKVLVARSLRGVCAIVLGANHDEPRRPFSHAMLIVNEVERTGFLLI